MTSLWNLEMQVDVRRVECGQCFQQWPHGPARRIERYLEWHPQLMVYGLDAASDTGSILGTAGHAISVGTAPVKLKCRQRQRRIGRDSIEYPGHQQPVAA